METSTLERKLRVLEAALFMSGEPIEEDKLAAIVGVDLEVLRSLIDRLSEEYRSRGSAIEIIRVPPNCYVMQARAEYAELVRIGRRDSLSPGLLKTLALVAYRQPISRAEIVRIRGNRAYRYLKELEKMGFIERVDGSDRNPIYRTTKYFSQYFGLSSDNPDEIRRFLEERVRARSGMDASDNGG